ncbi:hypothetical protein G7046_g8392 [Stylonectria norvegica]|nr:hypothetical protein G7046_g8392 [Stylonectria norvegica]
MDDLMEDIEQFQVTTPKPEPITDCYWPTLKKKLVEDPTGWDRLDLTCAICYEPMDVTLGDSDSTNHKALINACGHIFGRSCIEKMREALRPSESIPKCPTCRTPYEYLICKHQNAGMRFPTKETDLSKMSKTGGEGGGLPGYCVSCAIIKAVEGLGMLSATLLDHAHLNLPHNHVTGITATVQEGQMAYHLLTPWQEDREKEYVGKLPGPHGMEEACKFYADRLRGKYQDNGNNWRMGAAVDDLEFYVSIYKVTTGEAVQYVDFPIVNMEEYVELDIASQASFDTDDYSDPGDYGETDSDEGEDGSEDSDVGGGALLRRDSDTSSIL